MSKTVAEERNAAQQKLKAKINKIVDKISN